MLSVDVVVSFLFCDVNDASPTVWKTEWDLSGMVIQEAGRVCGGCSVGEHLLFVVLPPPEEFSSPPFTLLQHCSFDEELLDAPAVIGTPEGTQTVLKHILQIGISDAYSVTLADANTPVRGPRCGWTVKNTAAIMIFCLLHRFWGVENDRRSFSTPQDL